VREGLQARWFRGVAGRAALWACWPASPGPRIAIAVAGLLILATPLALPGRARAPQPQPEPA